MATSLDSFKSRRTLTVGNASYDYFSLPEAEKNGLAGISHLPFSLKVLLENLLRFEDGRSVTADDIRAMAEWLTSRGTRHAPTEAFELVYGDGEGKTRIKTEGGQLWFSAREASKYQVKSQSFRVQDGTVVSLLSLSK